MKIGWRLMMGRLSIQLWLMMVMLLPMAHAQQDNIKIGPQYIDRDGSLGVVIERTMDIALSKSGIELMIDGRIIGTADRLRPFKESQKSMAIVLCIDVSGSMRGGPIREIQRALNFLATSARKKDRFALVSFADDSRIESSFDDSRKQLIEKIRAISTRGRLSRIHEALNNTTKLFERSDLPLRRRVLIVSDGKDEGSRDDIDATIINFQRNGIVVDAVGRGKIGQLGQILQLLTNGTGGQFEHALPTRLSVKDAIVRIYAHLLEARSLVAYFDYPRDPSGVRSTNAYIILDRNEQQRLRLASPVPAPKPESSILRYWPILLLALLFVTLITVLLISYRRRDKSEPGKPSTEHVKKHDDVDTTTPSAVATHQSPPIRDATQVAGYYFPAPEKDHPAAVLMGIDGAVRGRRVAIDRSPFYIGASESNDLCIENDDYISSEHAYLQYQQGSLFIFDCGSSNATYVEQQKVDDTGVVLNLGNRIRLGQSVFEIMKGSV
jgi:hypothetical protein